MRVVGYLLPHRCFSCGLQGHLCSSTHLVSEGTIHYERSLREYYDGGGVLSIEHEIFSVALL